MIEERFCFCEHGCGLMGKQVCSSARTIFTPGNGTSRTIGIYSKYAVNCRKLQDCEKIQLKEQWPLLLIYK